MANNCKWHLTSNTCKIVNRSIAIGKISVPRWVVVVWNHTFSSIKIQNDFKIQKTPEKFISHDERKAATILRTTQNVWTQSKTNDLIIIICGTQVIGTTFQRVLIIIRLQCKQNNDDGLHPNPSWLYVRSPVVCSFVYLAYQTRLLTTVSMSPLCSYFSFLSTSKMSKFNIGTFDFGLHRLVTQNSKESWGRLLQNLPSENWWDWIRSKAHWMNSVNKSDVYG